MPKEDRIAYLGDGTYVRFDGYTFVIFTSNGLEELNHVYLEPGHIAVLNEFVQRMRSSK